MTHHTVAVVGDGQLARAVAAHLTRRADVELLGPASRAGAISLLTSGADLVIIATTTRLVDVADDIRTAVTSGSNVMVSAEESAYPWAADEGVARELDELARRADVTVVGVGVNPGLIFDALVLTLLGATTGRTTIRVSRVVDISRFGAAVLTRLGVGVTPEAFAAGVADGDILGHAGFPQSMSIVADAQGLSIDRVERRIEPILASTPIDHAAVPIRVGHTSGVHQTYTAVVDGAAWYTATFDGYVDLAAAGAAARDEIRLTSSGSRDLVCTLAPGIGAQDGSAAMVANSLDRVLAGPAGWTTVAELPPAFHRADPSAAFRRRGDCMAKAR